MKNNKGFTLVEIIVVLVILAILAAATIPSMLGFVDQAKAKAATAEARMVYVAAQAYATEKIGMGEKTAAQVQEDLNSANAVNNSAHALAPYVKGDATGTISGAVVNSDGKVTGLTYTKDGVAPITFDDGRVSFGTPSTSSAPATT